MRLPVRDVTLDRLELSEAIKCRVRIVRAAERSMTVSTCELTKIELAEEILAEIDRQDLPPESTPFVEVALVAKRFVGSR